MSALVAPCAATGCARHGIGPSVEATHLPVCTTSCNKAHVAGHAVGREIQAADDAGLLHLCIVTIQGLLMNAKELVLIVCR